MERKKLVSAVAGCLAFLMILTLALWALPPTAVAAGSSSIKQELAGLQSEAEEIQQAKDALATQQAANASDTEDIVARKKDLDQEIKVIHDEINNLNAQVLLYNQMISEKQKELDDAQIRQTELNQQYRVRLRTMEESGEITYWSVLFKANSFAELLDTINMISEIAEHDQAMLEELDRVAGEIQAAQTEMAEEKADLEEQKEALAASQAELDAKSAEADAILAELIGNAAKMAELEAEYAAQKEALINEIAKKEQEYTEALNAEEAARGQQGSGGSSAPSSSGWAYPLPYQVPVTSPYGWRTHPVTGKKDSFHTGVDLGAGMGTAIYASRSGTVTAATYSDAYGYYVTINHGDGYSSLYGHMTNYVVSPGDYVSQGQVIGYVGSSGVWTTGPHLHFTIYYNGSTVNPMEYI